MLSSKHLQDNYDCSRSWLQYAGAMAANNVSNIPNQLMHKAAGNRSITGNHFSCLACQYQSSSADEKMRHVYQRTSSQNSTLCFICVKHRSPVIITCDSCRTPASRCCGPANMLHNESTLSGLPSASNPWLDAVHYPKGERGGLAAVCNSTILAHCMRHSTSTK